MQTKSFKLSTNAGYDTPMFAWLPETEPKLVLHIVHGMAEHAERYAGIANFFAEKGIAVFGHENRAHGRAVSNLYELGVGEENWFYKQISDIHSIVQYLHGLYPSKKIFLLGHSMGSFLCQRYFQMHGINISGMILSASNGLKDPLMGVGIGIAGMQYKLFGKNFRGNVIDKLSFGRFNKMFAPNRTSHDWLSRDEAEVDKYVNDPYCGYVCTSGFFYFFLKGIRDAFKKENIAAAPKNIPLYFFSGSRDPVGLEGKGFTMLVKRWQDEGIRNISYKLYEDGRHEMMNEINRAEVLENLYSWISKNI